MIKNHLVNELNAMLRFQKRVLLFILKMLLSFLRYGLWILPWILGVGFLLRPLVGKWKAFQVTGSPCEHERVASVGPASPIVMAPSKEQRLDAYQRQLDSSLRSYRRISDQIRRR